MKENNKKKSGEAGVHMETSVAEEMPCNPFELGEGNRFTNPRCKVEVAGGGELCKAKDAACLS